MSFDAEGTLMTDVALNTPSTSTETPTPLDEGLPDDWDEFTEGEKRSYVASVRCRHRVASGDDIRAAINRASSLNNPRLSEVEWDAVAETLAAETPTRVVGGGDRETQRDLEWNAVVEEYLGTLQRGETTDHEWTLIVGNVRGFATWLRPRLETALATTPIPSVSDEGLDAERLARALLLWESRADPEREDVSSYLGADIYENGARTVAEAIIAEYRALSSEPVR